MRRLSRRKSTGINNTKVSTLLLSCYIAIRCIIKLNNIFIRFFSQHRIWGIGHLNVKLSPDANLHIVDQRLVYGEAKGQSPA